jgi:hypothetical protein
MMEQRYDVPFLLKDGLAAKEIPEYLSQVYGPGTMTKTQVFYSVREIHAGREDLSDEGGVVVHVKSILTLCWLTDRIWIRTRGPESGLSHWVFLYKQ